MREGVTIHNLKIDLKSEFGGSDTTEKSEWCAGEVSEAKWPSLATPCGGRGLHGQGRPLPPCGTRAPHG